MFGVSFTEIGLILLVALIIVGPHKLPTMLRTLGQWIGRMRRLTYEMRAQSGIDEILRQEGLAGGLSEFRALVRGELSHLGTAIGSTNRPGDPYGQPVEPDLTREYPIEGPDAYGALPDDLVAEDEHALAPGTDNDPAAPTEVTVSGRQPQDEADGNEHP